MHGLCISRLIRYSRATGSFHDLRDKRVGAIQEATEPMIQSG